MLVAEAVGRALAATGVDTVFGLMGSGNLAVTNALRDAGARYYAARQETGAVCMAAASMMSEVRKIPRTITRKYRRGIR